MFAYKDLALSALNSYDLRRPKARSMFAVSNTSRPKRLAHGTHARHDSTRIIRTSKALPHTPSAGLGRAHLAFVRRTPIASWSFV